MRARTRERELKYRIVLCIFFPLSLLVLFSFNVYRKRYKYEINRSTDCRAIEHCHCVCSVLFFEFVVIGCHRLATLCILYLLLRVYQHTSLHIFCVLEYQHHTHTHNQSQSQTNSLSNDIHEYYKSVSISYKY